VAGKAPDLFPRGKTGVLYFRMLERGRDRWISTRTADHAEAAKVRNAILAGKGYGQSIARDERSAAKLARNVAAAIVEGITGQEGRNTPIAEGLDRLISVTPGFADLSKSMRLCYSGIYGHFTEWCRDAGIAAVEDVTPEIARRYAKDLWEGKLSPRTFNGHVTFLSRIFETLDSLSPLPYRNPFGKRIVERREMTASATVSRRALEPEDLKLVIEEAAQLGPEFRDLILIGANTGLRLKDAVLLAWPQISDKFIDLAPHKTLRTGTTARVPISPALARVLGERRKARRDDHVLPDLAAHYLRNHDFVGKKVQDIFDLALGTGRTRIDVGKHRRRKVCVYGFHSLRVTFMSLLAARNVSTRDAMRMMAWESPEMVRHYERETKKGRDDADDRALKAVEDIEELRVEIPECPRTLVPTEAALRQLVKTYSNETIGQIYGMSGSAIHKWLVKFGIKRSGRVMSGKLDEEALNEIREVLLR
jgi:integrase